jgi:hypothetical protein
MRGFAESIAAADTPAYGSTSLQSAFIGVLSLH